MRRARGVVGRGVEAIIFICETLYQPETRYFKSLSTYSILGWSGGAMVLGKLPVPGRPTIWISVGQGPTALAVGAGGGCLDIFTLIYPFSPLSPSLWGTARYRLKYCLKGPLNQKQPTNQSYSIRPGGGRVVRWCWVNVQCRGVLQFGLQ